MAAEEDALNTPNIAVVGVVSTTIVFILVVLLQILFYEVRTKERERKRVEGGPPELRQLLTEQRMQLGEYRWLDKKGGVVALPIERAMELVAEEYAKVSTESSSEATSESQ